MSALLRAFAASPVQAPRPADRPASAERGLVLLRQAASTARAAPRRDPAAALAALAAETEASDVAQALVEALPALLGRRPVIWRAGSAGQSFDEAWLLAVQAAVRRGDTDSLRFLVGRRVRPGGADVLLTLIHGLEARLDKL